MATVDPVIACGVVGPLYANQVSSEWPFVSAIRGRFPFSKAIASRPRGGASGRIHGSRRALGPHGPLRPLAGTASKLEVRICATTP